MESSNKSWLEHVGIILPILAAVASGAWYVSTLQNQLENAQKEISELRAKLDLVSDARSSFAKGMKGDQGEPGPRGEKGPKGDQGEVGPKGEAGVSGVVDYGVVAQLVDRAMAARGGAAALTPADLSKTVTNTTQTTNSCTSLRTLLQSQEVTLTEGMKFCYDNGLMAIKIDKIDTSGSFKFIYMTTPKGKYGNPCEINRNCTFHDVIDRKFFYEEVKMGSDGPIAHLIAN